MGVKKKVPQGTIPGSRQVPARVPSVASTLTGLQRNDDFRLDPNPGEKKYRFRCRPVLRCENSGPNLADKKCRFRCRQVLRREKRTQTGVDLEQKLRFDAWG